MISIPTLTQNTKNTFFLISLVFIIISVIFILNFKIFIPFSHYNEIMLDRILLSPSEDYYVQVRTLRKIYYAPTYEQDIVELKHSYVILFDKKSEHGKIIYYGNEELSDFDVKWNDDHRIQIKNHVLNVPFEVYDYRIHIWK